jgi:hypothetical protein
VNEVLRIDPLADRVAVTLDQQNEDGDTVAVANFVPFPARTNQEGVDLSKPGPDRDSNLELVFTWLLEPDEEPRASPLGIAELTRHGCDPRKVTSELFVLVGVLDAEPSVSIGHGVFRYG